MRDWKRTLIHPDTPLRETIARIDAGVLQIALVVDSEGRLVGTVTDGDVRRAMLKGLSLDARADQVMNPKPTVAKHNESDDKIRALMQRFELRQVPLVDGERRIVDVRLLDDVLFAVPKDNTVVVMAGGLGSRLQPLTDERPKPMLKVGRKPILETILENFLEHGLKRFFFSVNYKAEMIKAHFGDGDRWGASIRYLEEDRSLGTAGALSLLPETPELPLVVMNGDVLTKVNFDQLLDFHREHGAAATACVREYEFQIPYGVVGLERQHITRIDEKPTQRFFVNAGIYVLEPKALALVPKNARFDMTALLDALIARGEAPAAFPIREYWIDIGKLDDYERADGEYDGVFR
jgi:dTDP-glucose pyrophosphorylase/predicted transcriptional regulator